MTAFPTRALPPLLALVFFGLACHPAGPEPGAAQLGAPDAPPHDTALDTQAIHDLIETTAASNNAGDVEGWVALFADDAVYMASDLDEVTTREGLRDLAATGFASWDTTVRIEPREIVVTGDWAFARNRVTGQVTPKGGGDAIPIAQKQIVLYQRQPDGQWKIARMIANRNPS